MASVIWFVYLARCADGTLYCGISKDVRRRIERHNAGRGARYTRVRRPVTLAWMFPAGTHGEALRLERSIKRLTKSAKERLIATAPAGLLGDEKGALAFRRRR